MVTIECLNKALLTGYYGYYRVFEQGITDWLRLMLRWKPHERGGQEVSPGQREWFDRLQEILSTKVTNLNNVIVYNAHP